MTSDTLNAEAWRLRTRMCLIGRRRDVSGRPHSSPHPPGATLDLSRIAHSRWVQSAHNDHLASARPSTHIWHGSAFTILRRTTAPGGAPAIPSARHPPGAGPRRPDGAGGAHL